jgi:WS/DGAT/MGAT family acyltransferase
MPVPAALTALDASFLALETPVTPMHVGSLSIFEGAPFFDDDGRFRLSEVRAMTEERLHLLPRLRQRVLEPPLGLGRPVWVDDPDFDIAHHVQVVEVSAPGGDRQLHELVETLHMELLDRSRPLWQLWFVQGVAGGRVALIEKIHHAMVDGVSGVDVAMVLMDLSPEPQRYEAPAWQPDPPPDRRALLGTVLQTLVREPGRVTGRVVDAVRHPERLSADVGRVLHGVRLLLPPAALAPRTSLNQPVGRHRRFEGVRLSLADAKHTRAALGGTINDVVLAAVTGGLRSLLEHRGEPVDDLVLGALVPVSVRQQGEHGALGNLVAAILAPLPVGEADPVRRLQAVRQAMNERKERRDAEASATLLGVTEHFPAPLATATAQLVHHQPFVNVVVTNVPGPQMPLYAGGARMLETFPVVPLAANLDVSIGILSYDGQLTVGLFADAAVCPDVHVLAEGIEKSFVDLLHAADAPTNQQKRG